MKRFVFFGVVLAVVLAGMSVFYKKKPLSPMPNVLSLRASNVLMRAGPGRDFPALWMFQRIGLPMLKLDTHGHWVQVQDPQGQKGWMLQTLLNAQRTVVLKRGPVELKKHPDATAPTTAKLLEGTTASVLEVKKNWVRVRLIPRANDAKSSLSGWLPKKEVYGFF